jgi:hypothetical protein
MAGGIVTDFNHLQDQHDDRQDPFWDEPEEWEDCTNEKEESNEPEIEEYEE